MDAKRDDNNVTSLLGISSTDSSITIPAQINPVTGRLKVEISGAGTGDVIGPAGATENNIATYSGPTGKIIKDGGKKISDLLSKDIYDPTNVNADAFNRINHTGAEIFVTGIIEGLELTGTGGGTTGTIGAGTYQYISYVNGVSVPIRVQVDALDFENITVDGLGSDNFTYWLLDSSKTLIQQSTPPTDLDLLTKVYLGNFTHINGAATLTTGPANLGNMAYRSSQQQTEQLIREGARIIEGCDVNFDQASLDFTITGGRYLRVGSARIVDENDPNDIAINSALYSSGAARVFSDGAGGVLATFPTTAIDPTLYDDGSGTPATVTAQKFTRKRIYAFPSSTGIVFVEQLGKNEYISLTGAKDFPEADDFNEFTFVKEAVLLGTLIIKQNVTNLSTTTPGTDYQWLANIKESSTYRQAGEQTNSSTGGGGGETNTSSNSGGFNEIALPKSGVDLPFRTIQSSDSSTTITQNADNLDITTSKSQIGLGNVVNADTTTTANITDSTNKRFVTDAEKTVIGNTSGTNSGDQDLSTYATKTGTETLTNKRITERVNTIASSATPTPAGDTTDEFTVTALAAAAAFAAPTGTPTEGQVLLIRIKDDGTARALTWNAIYRASTDLPLPTTTILSKTLYLQFVYNTQSSTWDLLGLLNNF